MMDHRVWSKTLMQKTHTQSNPKARCTLLDYPIRKPILNLPYNSPGRCDGIIIIQEKYIFGNGGTLQEKGWLVRHKSKHLLTS